MLYMTNTFHKVPFQYKTSICEDKDYHCKAEKVMRPPYHYNGESFAGKILNKNMYCHKTMNNINIMIISSLEWCDHMNPQENARYLWCLVYIHCHASRLSTCNVFPWQPTGGSIFVRDTSIIAKTEERANCPHSSSVLCIQYWQTCNTIGYI